MTDRALTRRQLLGYTTLLPLASLPVLQGCSGAGGECVDLDLLSRGEEQMREARQYADISPNTRESCAGCQFFRGYPGEVCGLCDILDGPVSEGGHCTSWAARG